MPLALVGWGWQPSQHGVMGILGLWHLACPDAVCRDATAELMLWLQLQSRRRPAHSLCRVQHTLYTKPMCWEQCAKHRLGLLLGLVLYQRRINKFKTDLAAFMKTTLFLLRNQKSVGLLVKEKCGSGILPLYEGNYEGGECLEMWKHIPMSGFQPQLHWAACSPSGQHWRKSWVLISNMFQLGGPESNPRCSYSL